MNHIRVIAAKTHTPEYLLHKYWARKPHNVISSFIRDLVPEGGVVVDPFCGSGVVLHEAQRLNRTAYGFDVNPTAVLISKVLSSPPEADAFTDVVSGILDGMEGIVSQSYSEDGRAIRYCVHSMVVRCPACGCVQRQVEATRSGKGLFCKACGEKLRLNLEYLSGTEIISLCYEGLKEPVTAPAALKRQEEQARQRLFETDSGKYSFPFTENRRILAFRGMTTEQLFSPRNFSILCHLSHQFEQLQDPQMRDAARLLLSASAAQCSRLIANRNNLSTGGPAWSIPGFWVPAVHLETNPLIHLRARLKKFSRGLRQINLQPHSSPVLVQKADARAGMKALAEQGISADLVFFDPPYGDNVPYVEFSSMWNSFLQDFPDPDCDISVSDRLPKAEAWEKYTADLLSSVSAIRDLLKQEGHLLITFNNNDMRAWKALLHALQANSMECEFVTYQIPAVVSSKAQKAISGSYISDIYSVCRKGGTGTVCHSLSGVSADLVKCASYRGGTISKTLAQRTMMIAWLKNNVSADLLDEMDAILSSLFEAEGNMLTLKNHPSDGSSRFLRQVRTIAAGILSNGPCDWSAMYERIAAETAEYGIPDPHEVRSALEGVVTFDKGRCLACIPPDEQLNLFD